MIKINHKVIAIIGLGYVGLPLAVEFGKKRPVVGFDLNKARIDSLRAGIDSTLEVTQAALSSSKNLCLTTDPQDLAQASIYIVTVPTPINKHRQPDLSLKEPRRYCFPGRTIRLDQFLLQRQARKRNARL